MRSIVGCILEGRSADELTDLTETHGVVEFPVSKSVVAEFPYTGKLSIVLGILSLSQTERFYRRTQHGSKSHHGNL
ncbi:hypothetical protein JW992_07830 [candidate division KSB1 bacterium]|nr:hypothetical protein [candidate division KSB1 bacterium]